MKSIAAIATARPPMAAGSSLPAALTGAAVVVAAAAGAVLVALPVTGLTVLPVCDELW